jgi:hypothetical protein
LYQRNQVDIYTMDPFVYLPDYRVVVYTVYQYAVLPSQISHYLSRSDGHNITKEAREQISNIVKRIKGLILYRVELDKLPIPASQIQPIPVLKEPRADGKKYPFPPYRYISCQRQAIQKHCREEHGWVNNYKRGR